MSQVKDVNARSRYELEVDGAVAFVDYVKEPGLIRFTHAEVPRALRGRGIGSELARAVLLDARAQGLAIVPQCPFIADYLAANPELAE